MGAVHYVYLAVAGGRVAYVGVGKRDGYYDHIYMHLRGHSSAARRGLRADVFIILAYTRRRRVAEMWEAWLHAVFKPPFNKRRPSAEPRKPPFFYTQRRRDKPVEEPVSMAKYAKLVGVSSTSFFTCQAEASAGGRSENCAVVHADRSPPDWRGETSEEAVLNSTLGGVRSGTWATEH
ncbi:hypothetical protein ODS41_06280 [Pyrobaculum sp. 3827-6]|uniref:hypothetical protein n=1 Tax=Pyrobaculum sp. 3827-6 TaxID=2983604 RepID=UPI0021D8939B|nr:hypothetical protein [Pyrobaculum sp. 3827-6]MCU7787522.1 hypothetical protein [Pyrobaculum sp. 3827-6]